jgi:hypothetical protein
MKKKINILIIVAMLFVQCYGFFSFSYKIDSTNSPVSKLVFDSNTRISSYNSDDNNSELVNSSYYVSIQFDYVPTSISSEEENFDSDDDNVFYHPWQDQLKIEDYYYYSKNISLIRELGFSFISSNIYSSHYSPFVTIFYENYDSYRDEMDIILSLDRSDLIVTSHTGQKEGYSSYATYNTSFSSDYPFSQALIDSGITNSIYTGNNIKVGIIEGGLPDSLTNFIPGKYDLFISQGNINPTYREHATEVGSVLGGTTGVASGSKLYFASIIDNTPEEIVDHFYSNNISVVNMSIGYSTGEYDYYSALFDYFTAEKKITFVASAGNISLDENDTLFYINPIDGLPATRLNNFSLGDNVISVGATSVNKKVSYKSSWEKAPGTSNAISKPNIVGPGEQLSGIADFIPLGGTSYSSPLVVGIIARLMQENATLKTHPELVMALLTNSSSPIDNQLGYDQHSGYGLVNYNNARRLLFSYENSIVPAGNLTAGTVILSKSFYASGNTRIVLSTSLFSHVNRTSTGLAPYRNYYLVVIRDQFGNTIYSRNNNINSAIIYFDYSFNVSVNGRYTIQLLENTTSTSSTNFIVGWVFDISTEHSHIFNDHYLAAGSLHRAFCLCGDINLTGHRINGSDLGNHYAICVNCGATVDLYTTTVYVV